MTLPFHFTHIVCMFDFWGRKEKLTLVAVMFTISEVKTDNDSNNQSHPVHFTCWNYVRWFWNSIKLNNSRPSPIFLIFHRT